MKRIVMYATRFCPYCMMARQLLKTKGADYEEVAVDCDRERRAEMTRRAGGRHTVPQIFIGGQHVGGYDDLAELERCGALDPMLRDDG